MAGDNSQFLSVKLDDRRLRKDLARLHDVDQNRAAAWALNETRKGIKTDLKRSVAKSIPIRASKPIQRAARRIWLTKGSGKATPKRLVSVSLQLYKYVPKIWLFGSPQEAAGQLGSDEFVQTMKSGHVGVFRRTGKASQDGKGKIRQVVVDEGDLTLRQVQDAIAKSVNGRWPTNFKRGAIRYINKSWKAGGG